MLLLDEPTNHLDAESVAWLEHFLEEYPSTVVAVTHDRYFLDNVAEWILELDRGHGIPWKGNYSSWLEQKGTAPGAGRAATGSALAEDAEARTGMGAHQPEGASGQVQGAVCSATKNWPAQEFQKRNETNEIYIPPGERLGDLVIECKNVSKGYGDRLLIDYPELSSCRPAASSASSAPTAPARPPCSACSPASKSPISGEIRIGPSVKLAYVDQIRDRL